jgi:hypothetical protein
VRNLIDYDTDEAFNFISDFDTWLFQTLIT